MLSDIIRHEIVRISSCYRSALWKIMKIGTKREILEFYMRDVGTLKKENYQFSKIFFPFRSFSFFISFFCSLFLRQENKTGKK